ncbi:rho GDP-dissociation inhibitor 1-like [Miscanthus floridulus]|uniref:rho GDP-dissociation inhibitor 1-like n=1 Tax=Miscanthus floridulus TaxID=154761 RepID=UPI00345A9F35
MDDKEKEKEKVKEKHADGTDVEEEEEDEEGNKRIVVLGPQVPLKEQLELDKDDESLRRWKEQLLGQVDTEQLGETAEPEVKVLNLTILSPGRPDLVLPIPFQADEKGYAFALKDGSPYSFRFSFIVSNNIVSGLKYTNTVWKTGVKVENQKMMLGTFSPQLEPYVYEGEEETTPAGIFARGSYSAKLKFVDDDGKCYLEMSYYFEIRKEWTAGT